MCDQLTSSALNIKTLEVRVWNISSHAETWQELRLNDNEADWREMEWLTDEPEPSIRFREVDCEAKRQAAVRAVLRRWPTCQAFTDWCLANCIKVVTNKLKGKVSLPKATYANLSDCTGLTEVSLPKATTAILSYCSKLKEVSLPMATYANLSDCTGLTEVSLPKATTADLDGCTGLTEVSLPMATAAYLDGCTAKRIDLD